MALAKNQNSYATVIEADEYFADRLDVDAWTSAGEPQRAQALITATTILDSLSWAGTAVSETQSLAFPRNGTYFDPRLGYTTNLDSQASQKRLITATFELAYHLLNNDGLTDNTGSIEDLLIEGISLRNISNPSLLPAIVKRTIKPMLINSGSSTWWRAN